MAKIKYKTVTPDAIIDIQVSGYFYQKIVRTITMLGESVTADEFKKALESIKNEEETLDMFHLNIQVLTALIYEIEKKAIEQNKTHEAEIEVPDDANGSLPPQGLQSE